MELPHTRRLSAERLSDAHFGELCRMHRDERVMATLGGTRSDEETRRFLRSNLDHWERHGYGLFVFRERTSGDFVGRGGLRRVALDGRDEIELAYAVMAEFWGRGLAREMAQASLELGFDRLGLADIVALTLTGNVASRRVMERLGFRFERDIVHAGLPHVHYRWRKIVVGSRPINWIGKRENATMILEIAQIDVKPGLEAEFEAAVGKAAPLFKRAKGCRRMELQRSIEKPGRYRLFVGWETLENHTVDFRGSEDFQSWRKLVGHCFASPPEVEHTAQVVDGF